MSAARRRLIQALSLAALVAVWESMARAGWVDPLFVPAPSAVARALGSIAREAVGLIGRNGAGKSTLLRCCVGLAKIDEGSACLFGEELSTLPPRTMREFRARVGFVFQQHNLVGRLSVLSNVLHGALSRTADQLLRGALRPRTLFLFHLPSGAPGRGRVRQSAAPLRSASAVGRVTINREEHPDALQWATAFGLPCRAPVRCKAHAITGGKQQDRARPRTGGKAGPEDRGGR